MNYSADTKKASLKKQNLTEIPEDIWSLHELQELNLYNNKISILPESIGQLTQLKELDLSFNQLDALPESIGHLKQLKSLDLYHCKLLHLPESIGKMEQLETLRLGYNKLKILPENIGHLSQLQYLDLSNNELTQLPKSLQNCHNLEKLNLDNNSFDHFPAVLLGLPKLKRVHLGNNNITLIPHDIHRLTCLKQLFLSNNPLETLPPTLSMLKQLQMCHFDGDNFKDLPSVLPHIGKLMRRPKKYELQMTQSDIEATIHTKYNYSLKPFFLHLMHQFDEKDLDFETRKNLFAIFQGKPEKLIQVPKSYFWQAMLFKNAVLNYRARNFLYQNQEAKLVNQPLNKSSEVALLGDFKTMTKTRFKEKLQRNGIKYSIRVKPSTTHIVLNLRVTNIKGGASSDATFITEQQLYAFLETIDKNYLTKAATQSPMIEHLAALLLSNEEANITLALEMMHGGGFPEGLIHELFFAGKIGPSAKIRKAAMKFLFLQVSSTSKQYLQGHFPLKCSDRLISKNIAYYHRTCPELDGAKIATHLFKNYRKGLHYILQHAGDEARRSFLKENVIFGNQLKINDIPGFSTISRTLLAYSTITHLHLKGNSFKIIPKQLHKFPDLTKLDLSHNCLKEVSSSITKASKLTHLNLKDNKLEGMPNVLCKMKQLQWINLLGNPFSDVHTKNTGWTKAEMVKQKLQKALPNCEIII